MKSDVIKSLKSHNILLRYKTLEDDTVAVLKAKKFRRLQGKLLLYKIET